LLRCLALLETPSEGRVVMEGMPISTPTPDRAIKNAARTVRSEIGMVFQHFNLFPHMTVLENIIEAPVSVRREPRESAMEHARELLRLVGLADRERAYPRSLSGGQQQQLSIARALVTRPQLLILDEPTEGIQPSIIKDIERIIRGLAARGDMAILLVEQYFEFARDLAAAFLVMQRGEIVAAGRRAEMDEAAVRSFLTV